MFKQLAKDVYEDANGSFCVIAQKVKNPKQLAKKTGLIKVINATETVVIIDSNVVNAFKKIELRQRLNLNFDFSHYTFNDATIPKVDKNYIIAAIPLDDEEVRKSGIASRIGSGRIAVRFQQFYRSNVAQNEINKELRQSMEKLRDSYKSELARQFCDYIIN